MVTKPDFEGARRYVVGRLEHELSPGLTYHGLGHTLNEVVPAVERLADLEKIDAKNKMLLLTGAYFHDLGFIHQRQGHESVSIQIAEETLPSFGYSESDIAVIRGIIQSTHLPQSPTRLLEEIMADADMDDLGAENFWERSHDLRQELVNYGVTYSDEEWYTSQLDLMQAHEYYTDSQRALRDNLKRQHITDLRRLLAETRPVKLSGEG